MELPKNSATIAAGFAAALAVATAFVMPFEGRTLTTYLDVNGVPTICNGITHGVKLNQTATNEQCDALIKTELGHSLQTVDQNVHVRLSVWQRAGLSSFAYNVGDSAFRRSSVLRNINANDIQKGCNDLLVWVYVGNKDCRIAENNCAGIVRRRRAERELCLKSS